MAIDREKVLLAAQGFIQRKRYDKAVAEYQKIIQQDPDDARTLLKIGDLQSKMEAHAEAIATYERVGKHYAAQGFALKGNKWHCCYSASMKNKRSLKLLLIISLPLTGKLIIKLVADDRKWLEGGTLRSKSPLNSKR